ncbi:MAG TPA: hypothetical protein PK872_05905 [Ferruginibacter sp.]|nr:hypothetical protein [Niastella sp.]HRB31026.1 hypothetical protein [Ferruginibacter sp.]
MNRTLLKYASIFFVCLIGLIACKPKVERPHTALDTGRVFIRASLDGDFKTAENLLLKDSESVQLFDRYKLYYNRISDVEKKNFKSADYMINKYSDENDSTTIINYSNSFINRPMEIKVVKTGGDWWVDFSYISSGNLPLN